MGRLPKSRPKQPRTTGVEPQSAAAIADAHGLDGGRKRRLDLELALGSITEADAQATVLGIFSNVAPKGAAAAIDQRLNGAITDATQRRMFDGHIGEVFTLPTGRSGLRTEFLMFAGLGSVDGFEPGVLEIVAGNAIRTLIRSYVTDLATVLIGGASGADLEAHLAAMMRGFVRGLCDADDTCIFRRVTLCERDPAKFEALRRIAVRLSRTALFRGVEVALYERELPAAPAFAAGAAPPEPDPVYLTISACEEPQAKPSSGRPQIANRCYRASVLGAGGKATVVTGEARVSQNAIIDLLARIDGLSATQAPRFGTELAALLLSADIRAALAGMPPEHPLVVINDREASRFPWEMLRIGGRFVARTRGLHRRYLAENLSVAKWLEERRRDKVLNLLLVANPTGDLAQAEEESVRIQKIFRGKRDVRIALRTGKEATRRRLLADFCCGTFDVIHYAGHAHFDPVAPGRSGILCAGREVLSGADLAGLNNLPSLVFFNACESGQIGNLPAAREQPEGDSPTATRAEQLRKSVSFAESFLRGGVANYIGTYWPVGDAEAEAFATGLYGALMKGNTMRSAVAAGRAKVARIPATLDWADYIHYGDQSFRLKLA